MEPIIVVPDDEPSVLTGTEEQERLGKLGDLRMYNTRPKDEDELIERLKDANIVFNIRATTKMTQKVIESCPNLKLIAIYGVGIGHVDTSIAAQRGVIVTNTPNVPLRNNAVAELAMSLLFAVARNIVKNDRNIRNGEWARDYGWQVFGKTIGVVGTGNIGERLIKLAKGVGMNVIAWTKNPSNERAKLYGVNFVDLHELMRSSDVVSLHIIGGTENERLIGKKEIDLMKSDAILINTSRGSIVDEDALVSALESGHLYGAGLDVFAVEPLAQDHPLRKFPSVVLSPHTGTLVPEATLAGLALGVDNVKDYLNGKPSHVVNAA